MFRSLYCMVESSSKNEITAKGGLCSLLKENKWEGTGQMQLNGRYSLAFIWCDLLHLAMLLAFCRCYNRN